MYRKFIPAFLLLLVTLSAMAQVKSNRRYDIVIYGATPAGVAAAIQAARLGKSVAIVEPSASVGGIMVNGLGGTDIDNHQEFQNSPAISGIALEFYRKVAKHYRRLDEFDNKLRNHIKDPTVWRFEPHVADSIIRNWLHEYHVPVYTNSKLAENSNAVKKNGTNITQIRTTDGKILTARIFIDATLEGDLLARAGVSVTWGRESNATYNETKNGINRETTKAQFLVKVDPYKIPGDPNSGLIPTVQDDVMGINGEGDKLLQAYCFRMCLTKNPQNRIAFSKPGNYDRGQYEIYLRYLKAGGKLYVPDVSIPNGKTDLGAWHDLSHNLYGMNRGYANGNYAFRKQIFDQHKTFTQGLFYFLANDAQVGQLAPALQQNWQQWGLSKDEFTATQGWPAQFYVRDARRMVSDYVITEKQVLRDNPTPVTDPVTVAYWPTDLHSVRRIVKDGYAFNEGYVFGGSNWRPFGISYRALVPKKSECTNLLTPTCPSTSHVAYGAVRIEFTFMGMGQACALAAAQAIEGDKTVQQVNYTQLKTQLLKAAMILDASTVGMPQMHTK
jgi:hypothetical protein